MREVKQSAGSNYSATVTVVRTRSVPLFRGLCDCFRQPRRVRPLPFKAKEQEMVETKPGRLIRVLHLLPSKRNRKKKTDSAGQNGNCSSNRYHQQPTNVEATINKAAADVARVVVHADGDGQHAANTGYGNEIGSGETNEDSEEFEDENSLHDGFQFSPTYDFENPFHPKNYLFNDEDDVMKVSSFAEHLAATVLDDALLELGTLWRLILPINSNDKSQFSEDNRCFFLDDEFEDANYPTWSSGTGGYQSRRNLNFDKSFTRASFKSTRDSHNWEHSNGIDNPTFEPTCYDSSTDVADLPAVVNGGNHLPSFNNYKYPSASSPLPARSSFNSCNGLTKAEYKRSVSKTVSRSNGSFTKSNDESDGNQIDQNFRIYRRPGGDEISSLPSTSFQSSTWGSSANSSLRYIRRFASRKFKTKPLMCFIHGIGDSAELWKHQLNFFQERGYETVAWDLIGHGLSSAPDKPKAYTFDVILTDVLVLFDRYSRDRNVIVAHAYGCCFAAALARLRSKQVAHLIMISGGGPFPLYPHPQKMHLPSCLVDCFRSLRSCGTKREMFFVPYRKQMRPMNGFDLPPYVIKHMIRGQVWLEGDASFHKQITIPTLLIYGLKDPYVNLVEECEMEKTIPRAFLELIPESGHMVMLETPDQVNDMMYKFLRRWNR